METIEVRCPFCAGRFRVAAQHAGKSARCRKCGERFELRPYVDEEATIGAALEEEKEEPPREPTPAPPSAPPEPVAGAAPAADEAAVPAPIPQADLDELVAKAVEIEQRRAIGEAIPQAEIDALAAEAPAGEPIPQGEIDALVAEVDEPVEEATAAQVTDGAIADSPAPQAEVAEEPFAGEVATALEETAEAEVHAEPPAAEETAAPGEPTPPVDAETAAAKEYVPPESPPAEPAAEAPTSAGTEVIALQCEVEELRGAVESLREETGRRVPAGGTPSPRGAAHWALQVALGLLSAATAGLALFILVKSAELDWTARLLLAAPWFALAVLPLFAMGLLSSLERIREAIERAGGTRG